MRTRFRSVWSVLAVAVLVAVLLPGGTAGADPVPNFYVSVSANPSNYGLAPLFQYTPIHGGLPPGATLIGHATCSLVYDTGTSGPTESSYGPNNSGLDPGLYAFVSSSCAPDPAFPLQLDGVGGSYNLVLSGGYYAVSKATTAVGGAGTQGALQNGVPTPTILTAVVLDTSTEEVQLAGKQVTFSVQLGNGVWDTNRCTAVTTEDTNGNYAATCTLSNTAAGELYQGTGVWTATFPGDSRYGGSSFTGQVSGLTSSAAAAKALDAIVHSNTGVTIVAEYVPPECDNPDADDHDGSIISVSIGELNCSQLQALQITTGIVLGFATVVGAGSGVVIDAAEEVAYNVAREAVNAYLKELASRVVVIPPPDTI